MSRPRVLIEQWFPIEELGIEARRENSTGQKPPLNRLHVWWARRPLTVSRAAIPASLLPAYPNESDSGHLAKVIRKKITTFDAYKSWFLKLIGIHGDPVAGRKLIAWANDNGIRLKEHPYG